MADAKISQLKPCMILCKIVIEMFEPGAPFQLYTKFYVIKEVLSDSKDRLSFYLQPCDINGKALNKNVFKKTIWDKQINDGHPQYDAVEINLNLVTLWFKQLPEENKAEWKEYFDYVKTLNKYTGWYLTKPTAYSIMEGRKKDFKMDSW